MGIAKLTIAMMMAALFGIAILTFAINFGVDNSASINLADDDEYNNFNSTIQTDVQTFYNNANQSYDSFQKSTQSLETEATEGGSQFKVTPGTSLGMFRTSLSTGFNKIFGNDSSFSLMLNAVLGILILLVGLYAWRAWKGNP